ncbi:MAG: DUF1858 domain-containing protein [Nanoarchaeota archaeon]
MLNKINEKMTIGEVVEKYPKTAEVMLKYGLHCVGCSVAGFETIEQGAKRHGMDDKEIEKMILEMNEVVVEKRK